METIILPECLPRLCLSSSVWAVDSGSARMGLVVPGHVPCVDPLISSSRMPDTHQWFIDEDGWAFTTSGLDGKQVRCRVPRNPCREHREKPVSWCHEGVVRVRSSTVPFPSRALAKASMQARWRRPETCYKLWQQRVELKPRVGPEMAKDPLGTFRTGGVYLLASTIMQPLYLGLRSTDSFEWAHLTSRPAGDVRSSFYLFFVCCARPEFPRRSAQDSKPTITIASARTEATGSANYTGGRGVGKLTKEGEGLTMDGWL